MSLQPLNAEQLGYLPSPTTAPSLLVGSKGTSKAVIRVYDLSLTCKSKESSVNSLGQVTKKNHIGLIADSLSIEGSCLLSLHTWRRRYSAKGKKWQCYIHMILLGTQLAGTIKGKCSKITA